MDSGCVLYLVRVSGSVVGLAVFWVGVLHKVFKETYLIIWAPPGKKNRGRPLGTWRRTVEEEMKEARKT